MAFDDDDVNEGTILRRDPRVCINSTVTGPEPGVEVKLRGPHLFVHDPVVQERHAARVSAQLGSGNPSSASSPSSRTTSLTRPRSVTTLRCTAGTSPAGLLEKST